MPDLKTERGRPLGTIEGTVPPLHAMPPGCAFEPRCGFRVPECARDLPPLVEVAAGTLGSLPCGECSNNAWRNRLCARCIPSVPARSIIASFVWCSLRILLLSDIHANLEALEACLAAAPAFDFVANLGDVVGYGASPNEVIDRSREPGKDFRPRQSRQGCDRPARSG